MWSTSPYHKQIAAAGDRISWALEVSKGEAVLGTIIMKGTLEGDLTIRLELPATPED